MNVLDFLKSGTLTSQVLNSKIMGYSIDKNYLDVRPDHCYGHDRNTFKIINELKNSTANVKDVIKYPDKIRLFMDHYSPPPTKIEALLHDEQRQFASEIGCDIYEEGAGIGHQIAIEEFINVKDICIGVDTHTCTVGALGALGLRNPYNVVAKSLIDGTFRFYLNSLIKINLVGSLSPLCSGNDIIFHLTKFGPDKFSNSILEFCGEGVKNLSIEDRLTVANLSYDIHARSVIFETDNKTKNFLNQNGRYYFEEVKSMNSYYDETIDINLHEILPAIAFPDNLFNIKFINKINDPIKINHFVLGTCTNGRLNDYLSFINTLGDFIKHPSIKLHIIISSRKILMQLEELGYLRYLIKIGAIINPPGCGSCMGLHQGALGPNDNCAITGSRNNKGRMGSEDANIFLCNPKVLALILKNGYIGKEILDL